MKNCEKMKSKVALLWNGFLIVHHLPTLNISDGNWRVLTLIVVWCPYPQWRVFYPHSHWSLREPGWCYVAWQILGTDSAPARIQCKQWTAVCSGSSWNTGKKLKCQRHIRSSDNLFCSYTFRKSKLIFQTAIICHVICIWHLDFYFYFLFLQQMINYIK